MKLWLLLFIFNGQPYVSGPHNFAACLETGSGADAATTVAVCQRVDDARVRVVVK